MRISFTLLFICLFTFFTKAQNFNGQWKGYFTDNSMSFMGITAEKTDFVLELQCSGSDITGYSYTYFTEGGKHYFTICKLRGTLNRSTKEISVTEFERVKFNTPPEISNCFQTHKLKYSAESSDTEVLQGSWIPAPNQDGNCGYGRTTLSRLIIKKHPPIVTRPAPPVIKKEQPFKDMNRQPQKKVITQSKPIIKNQPKKIITAKPPAVKNNTTNIALNKPVTKPQIKKDSVVKKETPIFNPPAKRSEPVVTSNLKFENRVNSVLKIIPLKSETFTVDFYDNGEIDGDTISVFFNNKLVLSHKMLTDKPLTLTLTFDPDKPINELVMYAESLGTIPPNTALMIVHDGENRYEARIESDLGRNGTIRFTHKAKQDP